MENYHPFSSSTSSFINKMNRRPFSSAGGPAYQQNKDIMEFSEPEENKEEEIRVVPGPAENNHQTPVTGMRHILVTYQPKLEKKKPAASDPFGKQHDFLHMKQMQFYLGSKRLDVGEKHYYPSFIAEDVEELAENPNARKALRQYKIFKGEDEEPDDEDDLTIEEVEAARKKFKKEKEEAKKRENRTFSRQSTRNLQRTKSIRKESRKSSFDDLSAEEKSPKPSDKDKEEKTKAFEKKMKDHGITFDV